MAKKGEDKNPRCATIIPPHWPKFTGPAWDGKTDGRKQWSEFLREHNRLTPTPRVPRGV